MYDISEGKKVAPWDGGRAKICSEVKKGHVCHCLGGGAFCEQLKTLPQRALDEREKLKSPSPKQGGQMLYEGIDFGLREEHFNNLTEVMSEEIKRKFREMLKIYENDKNNPYAKPE